MAEIIIPLHINSVLIDEVGNTISINVSGTSMGYAELWSCSGKSESHRINMSTMTPDSEGRYIFDITASEIGVSSFNGLYFMKFYSKSPNPGTNCCGESNQGLPAVVGNFAPYHECLLNRVLSIDFEGCGKKEDTCSECEEEVYYISALLNSLYSAVRFQRFKEACEIIETLNSFCDMCDICPPYYNENLDEDSDFFSPVFEFIEDDPECDQDGRGRCQNNINIGGGYGIGTINNLIMVV